MLELEIAKLYIREEYCHECDFAFLEISVNIESLLVSSVCLLNTLAYVSYVV